MEPVHEPVPIQPAMSFGPTLSLVWVLVVGGAVTVPFALSLWRWLAYRSRTLRAESAARAPSRVEPGPALLQGRVETEDGQPAVRIEIDQVGREWSHKGNWSYRWEERHRVVHVRPFRLRLADGESVEVRPDEQIRLVDVLRTEKVDGAYRRRVAELSDKKQVWVSGVLAQEGHRGGAATAYRSGPAAWVMRGTGTEPLEVASGGLERQFSYWQRWYRRAVIALGIVCAVMHGGAFGAYYALGAFGEVEVVPVTGTHTYTTTHKGNTTTHYVVEGRLPERLGGGRVEDEISLSVYRAAKNHQLQTAPFLYVPFAKGIHSIGTRAELAVPWGVLAFIAAGLTVLLYVTLQRAAMPWYEQRRVREGGSGRLADRAWDVQEPGRPGLFVPRAPRVAKTSRNGA